MLNFERPKKRKTFAIPALSKKSIEDIMDGAMEKAHPAQALEKIRKARIFIQAKLNGVSNKEAKKLADYTGDSRSLIESPAGQALLEQLLKIDFPDPLIVTRLKEMWDARNEVITPLGRVVGDKPDRDMQKYAMDKVLELRGYKKTKGADDGTGAGGMPTQIVFNVLPIPASVKPKDDEGVIDVQENK